MNLELERIGLLIGATTLTVGALTGSLWLGPRLKSLWWQLLLFFALLAALGFSCVLAAAALLAP